MKHDATLYQLYVRINGYWRCYGFVESQQEADTILAERYPSKAAKLVTVNVAWARDKPVKASAPEAHQSEAGEPDGEPVIVG